VKKTSYLVSRFSKSRQAKGLEPGLVSFAIHVLVGEHVAEHGHREWAKLDVDRATRNLTTNGYVAPAMVDVLTAAWMGFVDWLAGRGRLARPDAERLNTAIETTSATLRDATRAAG
jgi:hypothetical protein